MVLDHGSWFRIMDKWPLQCLSMFSVSFNVAAAEKQPWSNQVGADAVERAFKDMHVHFVGPGGKATKLERAALTPDETGCVEVLPTRAQCRITSIK